MQRYPGPQGERRRDGGLLTWSGIVGAAAAWDTSLGVPRPRRAPMGPRRRYQGPARYNSEREFDGINLEACSVVVASCLVFVANCTLATSRRHA